ncbi:MAG: porin [Planctomycetaceae bacterium]|jgi:hypothetical protein|nr:porin [Planctomycetaceae bacterium]
MKARLIIIVTIILVAFYFVVLGSINLLAGDQFGSVSKVNSSFPQPDFLTRYYQSTNRTLSDPKFAQSSNQSYNQQQQQQQQLLADSNVQSREVLLADRVSWRPDAIKRPSSNNIPLSFAVTHRKVTGQIIYDVEDSPANPAVCSPVREQVYSPVQEFSCNVPMVSGCEVPMVGSYDVPLVDDIGCADVVVVPSWYSRLKFYGWVQGGFYANSHGSTTERYHGVNRRGQHDLLQEMPSGNGSSLGNVRQSGVVVNQLWFSLSRELDMTGGFDWGFRGEFLFGTDAWLAQSYGDATFDYVTLRRDYGLAIPQMYITLGYRNLSVKVGKFESLLGFEHLQAVDSPFYSHSNLFYAEPQSHSGVLFDYNVNPDFWFSLGYVQGADSTLSNRFGDNGLIGGVYWRCCPSMTLWYTIYYSNNASGVFANNEIHASGDLFRHTFVVNWKLTSRLDYTFQWDLGNRRDKVNGDGNSAYFGWAQYFVYKIHQRLNGGIRVDQLHSNKLMSVSGFARPNTGNFIGDLFGITIGLDWRPYQNLSFKPELRYDYSDTKGVFGKGEHRDQISFGCGVVFDF